MSEKRSYGDSCGIARGLDLVGERWALLVVRELILGPKRFSDLRAGLPRVSADVLAGRLRDLEQAGLVRRRKLPPPAGAWVYELTAWGAELEPVLLSLGRWGSRSPLPPEPPQLGVDALAVALKTMFDPDVATGGPATYALQLGEHRFAIRLNRGTLALARGELDDAEVTIATDPGTLAALLWHGSSLDAALAAGVLTFCGDRGALERFLTLFPASAPAVAGVAGAAPAPASAAPAAAPLAPGP
jgi:DNA-binding HxlR family transcriptional regulator